MQRSEQDRLQIIGRYMWLNGRPAEIGKMHALCNGGCRVGVESESGNRCITVQSAAGMEIMRHDLRQDGEYVIGEKELHYHSAALPQAWELIREAFGIPHSVPLLPVSSVRDVQVPQGDGETDLQDVGKCRFAVRHVEKGRRPLVVQVYAGDGCTHYELLQAASMLLLGCPVDFAYIEVLLSNDRERRREWLDRFKQPLPEDERSDVFSRGLDRLQYSFGSSGIGFPLVEQDARTAGMFRPVDFLLHRADSVRHRAALQVFTPWLTVEQQRFLEVLNGNAEQAAEFAAEFWHFAALETWPGNTYLRWVSKRTFPAGRNHSVTCDFDVWRGASDYRYTPYENPWADTNPSERPLQIFFSQFGQDFIRALYPVAEKVKIPGYWPVFGSFCWEGRVLYGLRGSAVKEPLGKKGELFAFNPGEHAAELAQHASWYSGEPLGAEFIRRAGVWGVICHEGENGRAYVLETFSTSSQQERQTLWAFLPQTDKPSELVVVLKGEQEHDIERPVVGFALARDAEGRLKIGPADGKRRYRSWSRRPDQHSIVLYK